LTGVGAAHRRPNPGSAREGMTHVSPARLESLPAYKSHEENDEDAAPLLAEDAMMNDGIPMNSIEEDEGIDMNDDGMNYTSMDYNSVLSAGPTKFNTSNWTFGALEANTRGQVSGTGSDEMDDGASDRVNMNSSASEGSREDRLRDFEDSIPMDGDIPFEDQCPVPDASEEQQATIIGMHHDLAEQRLIGERGLGPFHVESGIDDDDETPAAEIHVDGESWKAE
jgi:ubiquitin carboxyl-terminal hydrolase 4/11/15